MGANMRARKLDPRHLSTAPVGVAIFDFVGLSAVYVRIRLWAACRAPRRESELMILYKRAVRGQHFRVLHVRARVGRKTRHAQPPFAGELVLEP